MSDINQEYIVKALTLSVERATKIRYGFMEAEIEYIDGEQLSKDILKIAAIINDSYKKGDNQ